MAKKDEFAIDHLKWLVEQRSENQKASLMLFGVLKKHATKIRGERGYLNVSQGLVSIAFSLWRAVFLSDNFGDMHRTLEDAEDFLGKLILDNAISYPQDRSARDWTFRYYLNNARYRLESLGDTYDFIPELEEWSEVQPKDDWERYQSDLIKAIKSFEAHLKKAKKKH